MKKIITTVLALVLSLSVVGCGSTSTDNSSATSAVSKKSATNKIVGTWVVESTENNAASGTMKEMIDMEIEMVCPIGSKIEITNDGKFVVLGQVETYEIIDNSTLEITNNNGEASRSDFALSDDNHLKMTTSNGQLVINFVRE